MLTYKFMSGETLTYPEPAPDVAAFLARVEAAAKDPAVSENDMISLIYGMENPLLDKTMLPGRAMVTLKVLKNPAFLIMTELLGIKRIQLGLLDPVAAAACYTISVNEAAEQLGITPGSVRAAIKARKIAAHLRNGEWYTRPEMIAAYKVMYRGRKRSKVPAQKPKE
jgi:hypothetical protein